MKLLILLSYLTLIALNVHAQDKVKAKFGDITEKDFATTVYPIDSNANAVIIADVGSSSLEGNTKSWFSLKFKHYRRVHILNKNGYDVANVTIPLYSNGTAEEDLDRLKAVTYNLENGKVVETKLDTKAGVFKDKINKNLVIKKFTFPNIKEGSIIEFEYTVMSDYMENLRAWEFQGAYPRLWSEYNLSLPHFFNYVFLTQGYRSYDINDRKYTNTKYNVTISGGTGRSEQVPIEANLTDHRWVIKDVPALKEESFTSTVDNYISKIEFQLSEQRDPLQYHKYIGTWSEKTTEMLKDEQFGYQLDKDNGWLKDVNGPLIKDAPNSLEKAKKIFTYVRDNFTCTNHNVWWLDQSLKNLVKSRNGSVAEINLLLTAMLKHAGIQADPVILSTKAHGFTYELYPLLTRFNYVVCQARVDNQTYMLDASEPGMGFGYLPAYCYNGHSRVVDKMGTALYLSSDSLKEKKFTTVFIINDEKGKLVGSMQQTPGYYESTRLRTKIKEKGQEQFLKDVKSTLGTTVEISNPVIDSLGQLEQVLGIKYDFDLKDEMEDIIYLNPMFGQGYKENPFKSATRYYPVEMPFTMDETYNLQLEVPNGYVVDELPKQAIVKFNDDEDGLFEYRLSQSGNYISMRSRIQFKRSTFLPEEYESLREFFNLIVKKHNEQIVFKKKK